MRLRDHRLESTDFHEPDFRQLEHYINDRQLILLLDSVAENSQRLVRTYLGPNVDLYLSFNDFTEDLAKQMLPALQFKEDCSTEKMLLNAFSGNLKSFSKELADNSCTALPAMIYRNHVRKAERRGALDVYVYTGMWIPYGNDRLLGNHPVIGFGSGGGNKFVFSFTLEFRFADAANSYIVQNKGQNVSTNHFFGGYVGLDLGYNFVSTQRTKFFIVGGTGLDGFDAVDNTSSKSHDGKSINAFNMNAGLGWRVFTPFGNYIGLEARNNFVNYRNPGGTPLDGNTVTIRLMYGFMNNLVKKDQLRRLHNMVRQ